MNVKSDTKSVFNGVVVLTIALIIVKILSALYRVPYQNLLRDVGLYAYEPVYPIVALGVYLSMIFLVLSLKLSTQTGTPINIRACYYGYHLLVLSFSYFYLCVHSGLPFLWEMSI